MRSGAKALTYRELDERSNQIANTLGDATGMENEVVAIMLDHGPELVAAILGALKAGKIYVSLDQYEPDERLQSIIAET